MRTKRGFTIVEQAITLVPEFAMRVTKLSQQITLRGQSESAFNNYVRRIAQFVLYLNRLLEQIRDDEINEYLVACIRS